MLEDKLNFRIFRTIEYFGHKIKLRKFYFGSTSYRFDYGNNISENEAHRLEQIMRCVPFGPKFSTQEELRRAFIDLRFPGYGSFYANQRHNAPSCKLELMSIDIPCRDRYRYFVVEEQVDGELLVVADFIESGLGVVTVRENGKSFEFLSREGTVKWVVKRKSCQ